MTANRIMTAIAARTKAIRAKVDAGEITQQRLDEINDNFDMDFEEYCACQQRKSIAVAEGRLTLEEGMAIYRIMGDSLDDFNARPLAEKVVVTQVLAELLKLAVA